MTKPNPKTTELALRVLAAYGKKPDTTDTTGVKLYNLAVGYLLVQIPAVQVVVPPPPQLPQE